MNDPVSPVAPVTLFSRDGIAALLGLLGAAIGAFCFSLDMFGGSPGLGTQQILLLMIAFGLFAGAAVVRYSRKDRLAELLKFLLVSSQLLLLALVLFHYEISDTEFYSFVLGLVVTGFFGNHFLPMRFRPSFFLLLSFVGMFGILGLIGGILLLVIGTAMVGICHLKVSVWLRALILLVIAGFLAVVRSDVEAVPILSVLMPILPSIFMFRLVIYLYDSEHGKGPKDWPSRLSYFFMLPNFVFPFYPVVDFAQWGRSYYAKLDMVTYQIGLRWIFFGTVHLLLYRFVNYYLIFDPIDVQGFGSFLAYAAVNFALYLKVSGLFHLILGLLHMFGFQLPETHSRFYLSFSFIEFWRRINIYWKDFMQKGVFNPVFVWVKKSGASHMRSVVVAICAVFFVTWALHAYQWFWLRGGLFLNIPDTLFWTLLGLMLILQTLEESRPANRDAKAYIGPMTLRVIRTIAMMLLVTILWAMWSSESWQNWVALLAAGGFVLLDPSQEITATAIAQSAAFCGFIFILGAISSGYTLGLAPRGSHPQIRSKKLLAPNSGGIGYEPFMVLATTIVLLMLTSPSIRSPLDSGWQKFIVDMQRARLSSLDQERLERGYYENLTGLSLTNSELWDLDQTAPANWSILEETIIARPLDDYRAYDLFPNMTIVHKGAIVSTNSHGMNDQEYAVEKPEGVIRIALVGSSRAMGTGVELPNIFDNIIETNLTATSQVPVEVLNFSIAGYDGFQKLMAMENEVSKFDPDLILFVTHENDIASDFNLARLAGKFPMPYDFMDVVLKDAGVSDGMERGEKERRLDPLTETLSDRLFERIKSVSLSMGAEPIVMYLPSVSPRVGVNDNLRFIRGSVARADIPFFDFEGIYDSNDLNRLRIAPWDDHPNVLGHQIIADEVQRQLSELPEFKAMFDDGH